MSDGPQKVARQMLVRFYNVINLESVPLNFNFFASVALGTNGTAKVNGGKPPTAARST
ncbi:hypothetical protein MPSYJ_04470 [Mycolicibacterium psychrotolerans]|uniref:Uncharacterized protein n=1 Tax=Mycolicibacterium psychrotolerans TaxID=216929 RepID=A0A7I7M4Z0_9MYCO|nr:hypothetical protein MPSYJ_04470 [Mycolicibacterium psychrotolerans]